MNIKDIKGVQSLVSLMAESDLSEITIEQKDTKLTLKRERSQAQVTTIQQTVPQVVDSAPAVAPATPAPAGSQESALKGLHFITAPLVGTYYSSSAPDAAPFVKAGDKISKGQILCIIEAMKLMNEIESDVNGTIVEVLCENASGVEYGTKIYAIKVN